MRLGICSLLKGSGRKARFEEFKYVICNGRIECQENRRSIAGPESLQSKPVRYLGGCTGDSFLPINIANDGGRGGWFAILGGLPRSLFPRDKIVHRCREKSAENTRQRPHQQLLHSAQRLVSPGSSPLKSPFPEKLVGEMVEEGTSNRGSGIMCPPRV